MQKSNYFTICLALLILASCVPQRLMEETKSKLTTCETESAAAKKQATELESKNAEMKETIAKEQKELYGLQRDSAILGTNLRLLSNKYDKLNMVNDQLLDKYNKLLLGAEKDNASLIVASPSIAHKLNNSLTLSRLSVYPSSS